MRNWWLTSNKVLVGKHATIILCTLRPEITIYWHRTICVCGGYRLEYPPSCLLLVLSDGLGKKPGLLLILSKFCTSWACSKPEIQSSIGLIDTCISTRLHAHLKFFCPNQACLKLGTNLPSVSYCFYSTTKAKGLLSGTESKNELKARAHPKPEKLKLTYHYLLVLLFFHHNISAFTC